MTPARCDRIRFAFRWAALAAGSAAMVWAAAAAGPEPTSLKEVRYWSSVDSTRIAIETSQDVQFSHKQLSNPPRVFIDLVNVRPHPSFKGIAYTIPVDDGLVQRVRVAPNQALVTRVVVDLDEPVEMTVGKLVNPTRIILDVRRAPGSTVSRKEDDNHSKPVAAESAATATAPAPVPVGAKAKTAATPPPAPLPPPPVAAKVTEAITLPPAVKVSDGRTKMPSMLARATPAAPLKAVLPPATPEPIDPGVAKAARLPSGSSSLTRVLGLKLNRIVLDAGHGGHDPGSSGPNGLVEKELVLDVTLRLGRLIEDKLGAEVIYTRKDDSFVKLEERAPMANRHRADLFLSIHANSSPARSVVGTETYYLNRTDSREDLAVAARENATAELSIGELSDLVKKIVLNDKRDESRELAARIQAASYEFTAQTYGRVYNRGVRHAPFVVLTGATMPSVLVEIGFMSNPKEETLLKKADHRQRLAEALFKGLLNYSRSLSHFSLARTSQD